MTLELKSSFFNHDAQAGGFFPMAHVGIDISSFGKKQNTLIEGIRGTGKTHILKMIEKYYLDDFEQYRVLPIFISLAQINEHARKDPEEFRLHLHTHIVERCIETVEKYRSYLQPDQNLLQKALLAITRLFRIRKEDNIDEVLKTIKKTAEHLKFKLQFDLTSEYFKQIGKEKSESETALSVESAIKIPGLNIGVGSRSSEAESVSLESEEQIRYVGSLLAHHNASAFLIEFLKQIQILLDLDYSLILLDECSEADFKSQVEIFRLFKTIRGSGSQLPDRDACAFFIGSVYPRGETYYPVRSEDGFSFQPGQDCTTEFLQWDETDLEAYTRFFREMTLSRARHLLGYSGDFNEFLSAVFDSYDTFLLSVHCANGIPRRYLELLKQAYDKNINQVTFASLDIAIQEIANNQILSLGNLSEEDLTFMDRLISDLNGLNIDIRRKNKKYGKKDLIPQNIYFSIKRGLEHDLRRLVMQGAVHDKARMRTTRRYSRPQPIFAIDMAVAYTYRIIPPKNIVKVIRNDIPRCLSGDFNQAPFFKYIFKSGTIETESPKKLLRPGPATGKVKNWDQFLLGHDIHFQMIRNKY
jgi:hypothetical protein